MHGIRQESVVVMEPVRCPNCNKSFVLMGVDDYPEVFELVLFCLFCGVVLQFEMQRQPPPEDDSPGQYL